MDGSPSRGGERSHVPHPERGQDMLPTSDHVVLLGAFCDIDQEREGGRSLSFTVAEFLQFDDGTQLTLHCDRGFTIGWGVSDPLLPSISKSLTRESVTEYVLNAVLPDVDDGEAHPWQWLARLARDRGVQISPDELRALPYEVVLSASTEAMLEPRTRRD